MSPSSIITVDDDTLTWQLHPMSAAEQIAASEERTRRLRAATRATRAYAREVRQITARVNALVEAVRR